MKIHASTNQTLLEVLAELSPESSKTTQRSWIKEGRITVDGQVVKSASAIIHAGQEVALGVRPKLIEEGKLRILYEDRYLVVIEKPMRATCLSSIDWIKILLA